MPADSPTSSAWPAPRIVYHRRYNIGLLGLERLHPFDSRKYGRAWKMLRRHFGRDLDRFWIKPQRPINRLELLTLHTEAYLRRLREPKFVAGVLEVPQLRYVPAWLTDRAVLRAMRWATMGTIVAANAALEHGLAINLSGGYHHANPDDGHGFSVYADVGLAVQNLRASGRLSGEDRIVYVDLDVHQGNGVFIYDQYNRHIFPLDVRAQRRIDCDAPVDNGCHQADYLATLRAKLPPFLDSLAQRGSSSLAIYNAGTDIYAHDKLGALNVSAEGVAERDRFVLHQLIERKLPTMVLLSGGYSRESYKFVADMASYALQTWGNAHP